MSQRDQLDTRREEARAIAAAIMEGRAAGQALPDAVVLSRHRDLLPELAEELEPAARIRLGVLAGEKAAGPLPADSILSWNALEAPLESGIDQEQAESGTGAAKPQIAGYAVLEEIGRGGQGHVYRALQESTDRIVAIKVMSMRAGSRHRTRIEREAKILAALRHPGIVNVLDCGQTSTGLFCLIMEFIEGRALDEYWSDCLPPGRAGTSRLLELFIKLAQAIGEAHDHGIVHRDLKPSNIHVRSNGMPCVLDFGLARAINGTPSRIITATGQILGSLPWASPEQAGAIAVEVGTPSDVYSLGVMLYQAIAGCFPYPVNGPPLELMTHIARTVPPAPCRVPGARTIGPRLNQVVLRALAKHPAERYASAAALGDALEAVLHEPPARQFKPLRRWCLLTALGAGLVLCGKEDRRNEIGHTAGDQNRAFAMPAFTNSTGMSFILIPAGQFIMGSPPTEAGRRSTEYQRQVQVTSPFLLGSTHVTQRQFEQVMGFNPSDPRWLGANMPVQRVTLQNANEFCRRLSLIDHRRYRLPTSEEWEYACRANTADEFSGSNSLDAMGWYAGNSGGQLHLVASKRPNPWGLYDMHGNAAEWCSDSVWNRPVYFAVVRGGSFMKSESECRSAASSFAQQDVAFSDIGFRVLLEP